MARWDAKDAARADCDGFEWRLLETGLPPAWRRAYFYHDTDGKPIYGSLRFFGEKWGIGMTFGGVISEDFQFHYKAPTVTSFFAPFIAKMSINGWMIADPAAPADPVKGEVKLNGDWYRIPRISELFLQ